MRPRDKELPKVVMSLIEKMLDEDCTFSGGTAEKSATELLERAIKVGREGEFKAAMKFWKGSHDLPEDVLWQRFMGVFKGAKPGGKNRSKYKRKRGPRPKNKRKLS